MAKNQSVWGIEIGQTALKAMRCRLDGEQVVVEAFDYIEYPKVLSQPEADADELVADALRQLIERNDQIRDKVCISVPGQSGLAKFFKPPPVEVKKVIDIVRYEAKQQIPFELDDVVWDFQMMPGSMVEEGYALESEVGLFAMKREQAYRQLAPFDQADIEVDVVQMAPMALYSMIAYDRMAERLEAEMYDADNPPVSDVMLSIGTDSSDLIVTNGFRMWQRSMPIGGNHFTRQLTKDLKLTFAKAEHLKRNAREAADPKLIFQTMRPVFNDLVTEVQRSIGFFRSIDKKAEIGDLMITGNTVKMPGLAAYLGKNLGFEVHVIDHFERLAGDDVLSIPTFRDNLPTFAVCYGLCLQGLGVAQMHASLVPREIMTARMVRAKKPWTLAGLAALLIGMTGHYAFMEQSWATTHENLWSKPLAKVSEMKEYRDSQVDTDDELKTKLTYLNVMGKEVSGNAERRLKWLEVFKAINGAIPKVEYPNGEPPSAAELPLDERKEFYVTQCDCKHYTNLNSWWTKKLAKRYYDEMRSWARITGRDLPPNVDETVGPTGDPGPDGPGWVFELHGYHFYNSPNNIGFEGSNHVRKEFTTAFIDGTVDLPVGVDENGNQIIETFTFEEMGLIYPLQLDDNKPKSESVPNPDYDADAAAEAMAANGGLPLDPNDPDYQPPMISVQRLDFIFQICWKESVISERLEARRLAQEAAGQQPTDATQPTASTPASGTTIASTQ